MTLVQLEYFIEVAEQLNFTQAAKKFYISQTAITQQIKNLEKSLKVQLLNRTKHHVELTPAGKVFYNEAKAIIERAKTAVEKTSNASSGSSGSIHIGYIKGYEKTSFSDLIFHFHEEYPNITISFHRDNAENLIEGVLKGVYDIVFSLDFKSFHKLEDLKSFSIKSYPLMAVLYSSHPFAHRSSIKRYELKNETFLVMKSQLNTNSENDNQILGEYYENGFIPKVFQASTDFETLFLMVSAGMGICILPEYITRNADITKNTVIVPLEGENEKININVFCNKASSNNCLRIFAEFIENFYS
jgi:DNA-binding transcriptional LysR family regulator